MSEQAKSAGFLLLRVGERDVSSEPDHADAGSHALAAAKLRTILQLPLQRRRSQHDHKSAVVFRVTEVTPSTMN